MAAPGYSSDQNDIVVHEFAHGVSTRLAGGAHTSSCLLGLTQMVLRPVFWR